MRLRGLASVAPQRRGAERKALSTAQPGRGAGRVPPHGGPLGWRSASRFWTRREVVETRARRARFGALAGAIPGVFQAHRQMVRSCQPMRQGTTMGHRLVALLVEMGRTHPQIGCSRRATPSDYCYGLSRRYVERNDARLVLGKPRPRPPTSRSQPHGKASDTVERPHPSSVQPLQQQH